MPRRPAARRVPLALVCALPLLASLLPGPALAAAPSLGAFQRTWARSDRPVGAGLVARSWLWGPQSTSTVVTEPYAEAPGGQRTVVYYDKARMELTDPTAPDDGLWRVTNGLLARELITGQLQLGDQTFEQRTPAAVTIAGDADDADGPTYASLTGLLDTHEPYDGAVITRVLARDGSVGDDPALASYGVTTGFWVTETGHAVAAPFWDFMNASGLVYEDGQYATAALFQNPFYATGYPISAAYWASVRVGGVPHTVLLQCFERRCLTYTPDNAQGWQVEAGNVGRHYFSWRYGHAPEAPALTFDTYVNSPGGVVRVNADGSGRVVLADEPLPNTQAPSYAPDGARIIYVASGVGGAGDLYVMQADGSQRVNLTNDEDDQFSPAWAPDGARILYEWYSNTEPNVGTSLAIMQADGSQPTRLTSGLDLQYAPAWSPDGTRVAFVASASADPNHTQTLYLINADGTGLTQLDSRPGEKSSYLGAPDWSPDSARVAFAATGADFTESQVFVVRADGTQLTALTAPQFGFVNAPVWSPDGAHIAFSAGHDGLSDIFSIAANADGAAPVNLTHNAGAVYVTAPLWRPDSGAVLYTAVPSSGQYEPNGELYLASPDGSGVTRVTNNTDGEQDVSWSPDGAHIVYTLAQFGHMQVVRVNADGSQRAQLTTDAAEHYQPIWSPDGSRIAYTIQDGRGGADVLTLPASGGAPTNVTADFAPSAVAPVWSPDGTRLAFASFDTEGSGLYVIDAQGGTATRLNPDGRPVNSGLAWSPDGARIAFNSDDGVYVVGVDGAGLTRVFAGIGSGSTPSWSPDSRQLVFDAGLPSAERPDLVTDLYIANADGSGVTRLTDTPDTRESSATWSPDGSRIAYVAGTEQPVCCTVAIMVVRPDGSRPETLTESVGYTAQPAWSPDGARLAYAGADGVYVMNADGSEPTLVMAGASDAASWAPAQQP